MIEVFYRSFITFRERKGIIPFLSYLGDRKVRLTSHIERARQYTLETLEPLSSDDLEFLAKCEGVCPSRPSHFNQKNNWSDDPWKTGSRLADEIEAPLPQRRHFMEEAREIAQMEHDLAAYDRNKWDSRS